jgi:hypothetical protein
MNSSERQKRLANAMGKNTNSLSKIAAKAYADARTYGISIAAGQRKTRKYKIVIVY